MSIERQNPNPNSELTNRETPKSLNLLPSGEHIIQVPTPKFLTYEDLEKYNNTQKVLFPAMRSSNSPSTPQMQYGTRESNITNTIVPIQLSPNSPKLFLVCQSYVSTIESGEKQIEYLIKLYPNCEDSRYLPEGLKFAIYTPSGRTNLTNYQQDLFLGDIMEKTHLLGPDGKPAEIEVGKNGKSKIFCTFSDEDTQKFGIPKNEQGPQYDEDRLIKLTEGFDIINAGHETHHKDENDKIGKKIMRYQIMYKGQVVGYAYGSDPNRCVEIEDDGQCDSFEQRLSGDSLEDFFHIAVAQNLVDPKSREMRTFASIIHSPDTLKNPTFYS